MTYGVFSTRSAGSVFRELVWRMFRWQLACGGNTPVCCCGFLTENLRQ